MSGHKTKPTQVTEDKDDGVAFPMTMVVRDGKGLGKMAGGKGKGSGAGGTAEGSLVEIDGGKLFYAPQIGFTLKVMVEGQIKHTDLYVDTGSALTWLEDKSGEKALQ